MVDEMERYFGSCTNHGECEAACPKEISIDFIALMNRDYVKAQFKQRRLRRPDRSRLTARSTSRRRGSARARPAGATAARRPAMTRVEGSARGRRRGRRRLDADRQPDERGSTASGESAAEAWVIRAGCSISDSTAPSDSASVNSCVRGDDVERGCLAAGGEEAHHAAEVAHLAGARRRGRGASGRPGYSTRATAGCAASIATTARAFAQCRSMRTAERLDARAARGSSRTATAPRRPRSAGTRAASPSSSSVDRDEAADDVGVTAEVLRASSARRRRRRARAGAGGTASRTCCRRRRRAPRACATAATAAMSTIVSSGFVGVSTQTSRVASRHARVERVEVGEVGGAPRRRRSARAPSTTSRNVPPYASSGRTTWSPGRRACAAPRPRRPCRSRTRGRAPRLRATRGTPRARARVGLPVRPYSKPAVLADRVLRERRRQAGSA